MSRRGAARATRVRTEAGIGNELVRGLGHLVRSNSSNVPGIIFLALIVFALAGLMQGIPGLAADPVHQNQNPRFKVEISHS